MNVVVSDPKSSKAVSRKAEGVPKSFLNKKIGETVSLDDIGLDGYSAKITGGSDADGFPMHPSVVGTVRKKILSKRGIGFRQKLRGEKRRKSVRGNAVTENTSQVNVVIVKEGREAFSSFLAVPKATEEKKSAKEEMIAKSLEAVGTDEAVKAAKEFKKK